MNLSIILDELQRTEEMFETALFVCAGGRGADYTQHEHLLLPAAESPIRREGTLFTLLADDPTEVIADWEAVEQMLGVSASAFVLLEAHGRDGAESTTYPLCIFPEDSDSSESDAVEVRWLKSLEAPLDHVATKVEARQRRPRNFCRIVAALGQNAARCGRTHITPNQLALMLTASSACT